MKILIFQDIRKAYKSVFLLKNSEKWKIQSGPQKVAIGKRVNTGLWCLRIVTLS